MRVGLARIEFVPCLDLGFQPTHGGGFAGAPVAAHGDAHRADGFPVPQNVQGGREFGFKTQQIRRGRLSFVGMIREGE